MAGLINVDCTDVKTVMSEKGIAMMEQVNQAAKIVVVRALR